MAKFASDIHIDVLPRHVWDVLTDFDRYTEWNPLFLSAKGLLTNGSRIVLTYKAPFRGRVKLRGRIVRLKPERELVLQIGTLIPGFYKCEIVFHLEATDGGMRLYHQQSYGGLVMAMIAGWNGIRVQEGCYALNLAIKRRSEDQDWVMWPRARG
tara:strand:- start:1651 stop:2112 length:462 start_codon:yes stop_codon:yes gene_type:complete